MTYAATSPGSRLLHPLPWHGMSMSSSGSHATRRWRKQDSNPWSLSRWETLVRFAADSLVGWWRSARTVRRRLLWQELLRFHRRISL